METVDRRPRAARRTNAAMAALFATTFALYLPTATFGFVNYDDAGYVYENPQVRAGLTLDTVRWAFTTGAEGNWHPLTWLSHALDWQLFGEWTGGHHLVAALLHATSAALLLFWLQRATGCLGPSIVVAAVFGWHPVHLESVAWVAERKNVLCALFFILGLIAYTGYRRAPSVRQYAAVTCCFVLALLSKPMAVTFPFVLLLLDVWPLGHGSLRTRILEKVPWFALTIAHSAVTFFVQRAGRTMEALQSVPLGTRIENAAAAYLSYAVESVYPAGLAVLYPYPPEGPAPAHWLGGLAFLAGGSIVAVLCLRRAPYVFTGWFWYTGVLVPMIGIVQVGTQSHADRYLYLPQTGLAIAAVWSVHHWTAGAAWARRAAAGVAIAALAAWAAVTWSLLPVWRDSIALFTRAIAVTKDNATAHSNLGVAYYDMGDYDKAIEHTNESLRIRPDSLKFLTNAALMYSKAERWDIAERTWREVIARGPQEAEPHSFLGQAIENQGRPTEAVREYEECTRLDPNHLRAHELLGGALLGLGRAAEAVPAYLRAVQIDPTRAGTWANIGVSLCSLGQFRDSFKYFQNALDIDPANADARYFYAKALASAGDREAAREQLDTLLAQHPGHEEALALRGELDQQGP